MCEDKDKKFECLEKKAGVLGWCFVLSMVLVFWWFIMMVFAGDFIYGMHSKFFAMSRETFNAIHYSGIAILKTMIFILFLVPYIAIKIVLKKKK
ncbi:MAG: DUF6868 family protein [Candidatus Omnitrophota bacterium]